MGMEIFQKKLGLIGFGRIGALIGEKCISAFSMEVFAFDPFISEETMEKLGVTKVTTLMELLSQCDVISVNVPLTKETRGLIGKKEFQSIKDGSVLLQLARGGVVDERALASALEEGRLRGAHVDVFEEEPPPNDNPLFKLNNVILTPHTGAHTHEAFKRTGITAAKSILSILNEREEDIWVNIINRNC